MARGRDPRSARADQGRRQQVDERLPLPRVRPLLVPGLDDVRPRRPLLRLRDRHRRSGRLARRRGKPALVPGTASTQPRGRVRRPGRNVDRVVRLLYGCLRINLLVHRRRLVQVPVNRCMFGPGEASRGTGMSVSPQHPRRLARITGLLWIMTFVTSIPAVLLYDPLLNNPNFILGAGGGDARIFLGAALEIGLIVANLGTAVVPFALYKRHDERLALSYVTARLVECGFIAVGIVSVLAIMTLRQDPSGVSDDTLVALGQSLVAVHDATFLLGPGIVVGIGNGLILGSLMYRSRLLPRRMTLFGIVGGPLVTASGIAVMFGAFDAGSAPQALATIPEIIWEAFIGLYLIFKGFNASSPVFAEERAVAASS